VRAWNVVTERDSKTGMYVGYVPGWPAMGSHLALIRCSSVTGPLDGWPLSGAVAASSRAGRPGKGARPQQLRFPSDVASVSACEEATQRGSETRP
jgi:hypothetical protein